MHDNKKHTWFQVPDTAMLSDIQQMGLESRQGAVCFPVWWLASSRCRWTWCEQWANLPGGDDLTDLNRQLCPYTCRWDKPTCLAMLACIMICAGWADIELLGNRQTWANKNNMNTLYASYCHGPFPQRGIVWLKIICAIHAKPVQKLTGECPLAMLVISHDIMTCIGMFEK